MPNGGPEEEARRLQEMALSQEERERRAAEAAAAEKGELFVYPLEGRDLIEEIQKVKPEEFPGVVEEALAFLEGLPFGTEDYNLDNPETLLDLQSRFTSAEGAIERPSPWYLGTAIKERVREEIRDTKKELRKDQTGEKEKQLREQISQLMRIENQREGRKVIDAAFVQRMLACEEAEAVAALLSKDPNYRPSVTPDKGHWQGALWGEFGEKVDKVLRRIVAAGMDKDELENSRNKTTEELRKRLEEQHLNKEKIKEEIDRLEEDLTSISGVEDTIYAKGFTDEKTFKAWLSHLLKATDGRMDIVWFAWRLALLWELPAQFGCKSIYSQKKERNEWKIADPPIGNDLHTWTAHLEQKRNLEWGLDADGNRARISKYLTHTGYPLSLGRYKIGEEEFPKIKDLCNSYLHEATVIFPPGSESKISLWKLWWEKGMKLGGHFEDEEAVKNILPWAVTEAQPRGLDTEELPPGSFGFWYLTRFRAFQVLKDIRSRPGLRDLSDPDFFAERLRNWEKVLGVADEELSPEKNPRTWWVAGLIMAHHLEATGRIPAVKTEPDLAYRTYMPSEVWSPAVKGTMGSRPPSIWEVLNHAYQCGFLRKKDIDWLIKNLRLPKPPLGASPY